MQIDNKNLVQDFLANDKSGKIEKEELVSFIKKVTAQNNDIEAGNGKGDQSTEKLIDQKQGEFDQFIDPEILKIINANVNMDGKDPRLLGVQAYIITGTTDEN